jgi:hypothetical protein
MFNGYAHTLPFFSINSPSNQTVNTGDVTLLKGPDADPNLLQFLGIFSTSAIEAHGFYFTAISQCQDNLPAPGTVRVAEEEVNAQLKAIFTTQLGYAG